MATRSQALALTQGITNFASGYANDQISQSVLADAYFITGQPIKAALNFEYAQFDRADGITIPNTKTAFNDTRGAILAFGGSKITGTLDTHRGTTDWYDVGPDITDADLLLQLQGSAKLGTQALVTGRFKRILDAASTAAGGGTTIDISDGDDAIAEIQEQVENVLLACGGYCNVRILMGANAYRQITALTKFQARINGGSTPENPSTPTEQQVAAAIGYNVSVKITNAVSNTAAVGQTASPGFLLSNIIYVAAVSPSPNTSDPSALKVFEGYGSNGFSPTYIKDNNPQFEACTWGWREKIVATNSSAIKKLTVQA
jgi:hypothetical protein